MVLGGDLGGESQDLTNALESVPPFSSIIGEDRIMRGLLLKFVGSWVISFSSECTAFGLNDRLYDSKVGRQYFSTTAEIVGSLERLHSKVKQRNFPSPVRGKLPRIQVVLSLFQFLFFRVQVRFHSLKQQINRGIK